MATVSQRDILLAILSMDTYHRAYNPGIKVDAPSIGSWGMVSQSVDEPKGFYGAAYSRAGETIIAYRGTDSGFDPAK
jgi:hypothetical protein